LHISWPPANLSARTPNSQRKVLPSGAVQNLIGFLNAESAESYFLAQALECGATSRILDPESNTKPVGLLLRLGERILVDQDFQEIGRGERFAEIMALNAIASLGLQES